MTDQSDSGAARDEGSDPTGDDGLAGQGLGLLGTGSFPLRRVLDVLLVGALVLVIVPFAVYAAPSLVGAEDSYIVRSGSMAPAIETGDVVIVERAAPAEIETGDVITFVPDGQPPPTTHRVVSKAERDGVTYFTTKGDANDQPDAEPVVENELVGEVTLVLPYVGYVVSFASTSVGFFALVAAPFGLLLATEVWSLFRADDGEESGPDGRDGAPAPGPSPDVDGTVEAGTDETTYTLSPTDIRLSLAVLLVLTGYSSLVAVSRPTPWSIAVAVAAFGTTVYLAAMRYTAAVTTGTSGPEPTTGTSAPEPTTGTSGPEPTTGTSAPEPMSTLPPTREVAPADGDGRGLGPVAAGDGPGANGTLGGSLAGSSVTRFPDGAEPVGTEVVPKEPEESEAFPEEPEPGDGAAGNEDDSDAATAADEPSDRSTDVAGAPDTEPAESSVSESRGLHRRLRAPFAAATGAVYRFLYRVGYLEVTLVRAVLRRAGLRSDGGER